MFDDHRLGIKLGTPSPVDLNVWSPTSWSLSATWVLAINANDNSWASERPTKPEALRVAQQKLNKLNKPPGDFESLTNRV